MTFANSLDPDEAQKRGTSSGNQTVQHSDHIIRSIEWKKFLFAIYEQIIEKNTWQVLNGKIFPKRLVYLTC